MPKPITEKDLHEMRTAIKIVNLENLLRVVLRMLASMQGDQKQALQALADSYLASLDGIKFPAADAAHSQMLADEMREIAKEYLDRVIQD